MIKKQNKFSSYLVFSSFKFCLPKLRNTEHITEKFGPGSGINQQAGFVSGVYLNTQIISIAQIYNFSKNMLVYLRAKIEFFL